MIQPTTGSSISVSVVGLPTFYGQQGTATPSQSVGYIFSGAVGSSGAIATASGVEYSINGGSSWSASISGLTAGSGTLLIRGAAATANGTYGPENVTFSATGAISVSVVITLVVNSNAASVVLNPTSLSLPSTVTGTQGSSLSYSVTGRNLSQANYTVTAPANTVISNDNVNWVSSYTIPNAGGGIDATTFVALSSAAAPGSYSGFVTYTAADISGVQDTVSGTVASSGGAVDTVVAKFLLDSTAQNVVDWVDVAGNPHTAVRTATDSRNWQPVTFSTISTSKWVGIGSLNVASSNLNGNFATVSPFAGVGITFDYNTVNGSLNPGFTGWVNADTNFSISGLDPTKLYTIQIFCSVKASLIACSSGLSEIYIVDSTNLRVDSQSISIKGNTTTALIFKNKRPNANGTIYGGCMPIPGGNNVNCGYAGEMGPVHVTKQVTREGFESWWSIILLFGFSCRIIRKSKCVLVFWLILISIASKAQDSTLTEMTSNGRVNSPYNVQRRAILNSFRRIRDSIIRSQPSWVDSIVKYASDTSSMGKEKESIFQDNLKTEKETMRLFWCPFSEKIYQLNRKYRVVGDRWEHCYYLYEQQ